jgi:hypothetical protein
MAANTTFTAGQVVTAAQMNNLPWGVMGTAVRTTGDLTLTTTNQDLTSMSITFTAIAGRLYRASWSGSAQKSTAAGYTQITLADSTNALYGYSLGYTVSGNYVNLSGVSVISGLTAGSKTFKLRGITENNTAVLLAGGTAPLQFMIEDMGAA